MRAEHQAKSSANRLFAVIIVLINNPLPVRLTPKRSKPFETAINVHQYQTPKLFKITAVLKWVMWESPANGFI